MNDIHSCEYCGDDTTMFTTNPFAEEINKDDTKHWICDKCYYESCRDI